MQPLTGSRRQLADAASHSAGNNRANITFARFIVLLTPLRLHCSIKEIDNPSQENGHCEGAMHRVAVVTQSLLAVSGGVPACAPRRNVWSEVRRKRSPTALRFGL